VFGVRRIDVGFACNNACVFCAQGSLRDARPAAAEAAIATALAAIAPGDHVAFVGGEPTIFGALPAWIREAGARGAARVTVQTNGRRLAYAAYARELRASSAALHLDVSLHGSTAPMHDWHTATADSFTQTVRGLRHARAERIPVAVTTVVTRSNYRHLAEIVRVAHALGAHAVRFAALATVGRALDGRSMLVPAPELVAPHLHRAQADAARLGVAVLVGEPAEQRDPRGGREASTEGAFAGLGQVEAPVRAAERVEEAETP
jgi:cyclic pyranopterin phosphate synthase